MQASQPLSPRQRPLGVAVVALFLVLDSALAATQVIFDTALSTRTQTLLDISEWMPGLVVAAAAPGVVVAVGLWLGLRWAWVGAMLMVGAGLVFSLVLYWIGDPSYVRMAIGVVIAFYLNQGVVRDHFEGQRNDAAEQGH